MHRLLFALPVLLVIGALVAAAAPADAARHKKVRPAAARPAPAYLQPAARPSWAGPQECFTDNGYGRYLPCALGDGR